MLEAAEAPHRLVDVARRNPHRQGHGDGGGDDKGLDAAGVAAVAREAVKVALALPGPGTDRIQAELDRQGVRVEGVPDLASAVDRAVELAEPGDKVLLSPACPGFFSLYYVGAEDDLGFKKLVRAATLGEGAREQGAAAEAVEPTSPPARKPRR